MAVQNTGDAAVFFDEVVDSALTDDLISAQVDPTQPQVQGLDSVTSPLVPDRHLSSRLSNFDPKQFDLSEGSHLMRLLQALLGAGGIGGLRRQMTMARMSNVLSGTNWLELDGFWGKLFALPRDPMSESLPGDPATTVADSFTWDLIASADGRYRSRIEQLAKGFASGATYHGVYLAATAILSSEVQLIESWIIADSLTPGAATFQPNTYFAVESQYTSWGGMSGHSYAELAGAIDNPGQTPVGNRGEVTVIPGRSITEAERWTLMRVLNQLAPAGVTISVASNTFSAQQTVTVRDVEADSNDWSVVSRVSQQQAVDTGALDLYPASGALESGRPGFGSYSGEKWYYNGQVSSVTSYASLPDGTPVADVSYDTVTYSDGFTQEYVPGFAMADSTRMAMARAAADGVLTTFPYADGRTG